MMRGGAVALVCALALGTAATCAADEPPVAAEAGPDTAGWPGDVWDPWEPFNRKMFWFNDRVLDRFVLAPVATGWDRVAPDPVQRSVSNFFDHTTLPLVVLHDLLQWKPKAAGVATGRFLANTLMGGVGFLDPATDWGLPDQDEDAGQTFAVWGLGPGPYVVVPFWGPTTVRDGVGQLADNAWVWFTPGFYTTGARMVAAVNERSLVLDEVDEARQASLDFYSAVRHAYGARRARQIEDREDTKVQDEDQLYFPE
jgi:phospholipid-binding lipoprotein MlaA